VSRNSTKLNTKPAEQTKPETHEQNRIDNLNPFGLSFVVPTEKVPLPTGGAYYPSTSPLHGVETVEIKHMTAREEDLLSGVNEETENNIFNTLINSLLTDKQIKAEDMIEEDKMAVLLKARSTGYGRHYSSKLDCESCGKTTEHVFDLDKTSIEPATNKADYNPEANTYSFDLPVSKLTVSVRMLSDSDKKQLESERKKKKDLNIPFNTTLSTLKRVLVSANGVNDLEALNKLVDVLPAADAKKMLNFYDGIFPRLSTRQEVTCGSCGAQSEREVPLTWAFFRIDI